MDQKIFNNILLLLIILILIKYLSPNPDSVLFIIKKYVNFIIYRMKRVLYRIFGNETEDFRSSEFNGKTFGGIDKFNLKAPNFPSPYQNYWVKYIIKKNPKILIETANKLYNFIENLVTIDTDDYFISASNIKKNEFTDEQLVKIQNIILQKLNSGSFKFKNFKFIKKPFYYNNVSGKEVDPFTFSVDCSENIDNLIIFIELNIRNDIVQNFEYVTINKIRIVIDTQPEIKSEKQTNIKSEKQQEIIQVNTQPEMTHDMYNEVDTDYTTNLSTIQYKNNTQIGTPIIRLMEPSKGDSEPEANSLDINTESFAY
jgi:hypothetical protein